jgi:hypothetical protein
MNKKIFTPDELKIIQQLDSEIFYGFIIINVSLISLGVYSFLI